MTRITSSDQVLLLLRGHLERARRTGRKGAAAKPAAKGEIRQSPVGRLQATLQVNELSPDEVRRSLISGLLTEEFGAAAANDPKFQQVVADVTQAIARDEVVRTLLDQAIAQLTHTDE